MGATRCNTGSPQTCKTDAATGCPFWATTTGQPDQCSANQTCDQTSGTCKCNNDAACGNPATAGDFCPTEGGATHSTCVQGADGCFTVTNGTACAAGTTCQTGTTSTIVPAGTACGCAPPVDPATATGALNGQGCTQAQATAGTRVGSASDDAILTCKVTATGGSCYTWQITTSCASQQLTGGTDPVTSLPACVCKLPAVAKTFYVDPDPSMSTFMTGPQTGAQFPAACRFRTLTTAIEAGGTTIIAQHETSSNVRFLTSLDAPQTPTCDGPNTCEKFPINIPTGVHVTTSDVGSFNPSHYVIEVDHSSSPWAVQLGTGATFEGYTVDASGSDGLRDAAVGVTAVIASPFTGDYPTATPAVAPRLGTLNQVLVLSGGATAGAPIGVLVRGQANWTATYLSVIGGALTTNGIVLNHASDGVLASTNTLTATHLNVQLSGATNQIGVQVGTNNAVVIDPNSGVNFDAGNILSIANDPVSVSTIDVNTTSPHNVKVGPAGTGFLVYNGTVTVSGLDVGSNAPAATGFLTGYDIRNSNAAPKGVNLSLGTIVAGNATGGVGITAVGGVTTVNGTHISGIQSTAAASRLPWFGVVVASTDTTLAGDVTLTGTTTAKTVIDTTALTAPNVATSTSDTGIMVGSAGDQATATALSRLTITDNVTVGGTATAYFDGIVVNNGRFVSTGTGVTVSGNWEDGIQLLGTVNPQNAADPLGQGSVTGATVSGNKRLGFLVLDQVPVTLSNVTISGNGTAPPAGTVNLGTDPVGGGIDVVQSQATAQSGYLFKLTGSHVTGNLGCGVSLTGGYSAIGAGGTRVCGVADPGFGGKVSGDLENNTVSGNLGVGIYVTEAPNAGDTGTGQDVTEVILQSNTVTGNLTATYDPVEPIAGGVYFAASDANGGGNTAASVACAGNNCTRVRAEKFLGNTISCNGRHELAYAIPQRTTGTATGSAWDIGSAAGSVDMTTACSAGAFPNTLTGYGSQPGLDLGLAVTTPLIRINALGVHWENAVPAAGVDYSAALGVAPTGNNDAAAFVFCSAVAATCQ